MSNSTLILSSNSVLHVLYCVLDNNNKKEGGRNSKCIQTLYKRNFDKKVYWLDDFVYIDIFIEYF